MAPTAIPIIHIDFSGLRYGTKEELSETLDYLIDANAEQYNIQLKEKGYDKRFRELISALSKQNSVVILVDEYDKPIIDYVEDDTVAKTNREIISNFYSSLKGADEYIKFALFTGVSKFSKVSVFSGLNNLDDITLDRQFAELLGYTENELETCFADRIKILAEYSGKFTDEAGRIVYQLSDRLNHDDIDGFFQLIKSMFASIPYNIFIGNREAYYHTVIYLVMALVGLNIEAEVQTNAGRIDAVIHADETIFIMEFKIGTPEETLEQIKDKKYYEKYLPLQKAIKLVGVGFAPDTRDISGYKTETVSN